LLQTPKDQLVWDLDNNKYEYDAELFEKNPLSPAPSFLWFPPLHTRTNREGHRHAGGDARRHHLTKSTPLEGMTEGLLRHSLIRSAEAATLDEGRIFA
jgi:hypothetical protein